MKQTNDLKAFHSELNDELIKLEQTQEFPGHFYQAFLSGENTLYQKNITETKIFDEDWIGTIESYFPSLNKICMQPKTGLRYEQEVTAIEKAKKVGSHSIRHLSSHSHLIREITDDNVVPKRILVTESEIEYATYENRFIKTLIERLYGFVEHRYTLVKNFSDAKVRRHFNLESDFEMRDSNYKMTIDLEVNEALQNDTVSLKNRDLLKRVENLLKLIMGLQKTPFMEDIKNAKPIMPPIMKTSIIVKNVDYNNGYLLWLFLDKYNTLPFEINVAEQNLTFDRYYLKNIYQSALVNFSNIIANQAALEDHYQYLDVKTYSRKTPKIVKSNPKDLIETPDPFVVEKQALNQYYLEQNKKIFERNLEAYQEETGNYQTSLRKAIKDTLQITNALYQSFFEFETELDQDIFTKLVKRTPEEELLEVKNKARIARIIRETKEVDYKDSIRLEKRLMKEVERLDKKLIRETKKQIRVEAKQSKIEERLRLEREAAQNNQEILSEHMNYVKEQNEALRLEHLEISERIKDEKAQLKLLEAETIEKEKLKAQQDYEVEVQKLQAKIKREKDRLAKKLKKQEEIEKLRLRNERQKMQIKHKQALALKKEQIRRNKEKKIKTAQKKAQKQLKS
ncbi:MAG: DUF2357 domain-containing protein [Acholeplasmataceae bacterium]